MAAMSWGPTASATCRSMSIARAIGLDGESLCQACITGEYPTPCGQQLYDISLDQSQKGDIGGQDVRAGRSRAILIPEMPDALKPKRKCAPRKSPVHLDLRARLSAGLLHELGAVNRFFGQASPPFEVRADNPDRGWPVLPVPVGAGQAGSGWRSDSQVRWIVLRDIRPEVQSPAGRQHSVHIQSEKPRSCTRRLWCRCFHQGSGK